MARGHAMEAWKQMSRAAGEPKMCYLSIKTIAARADSFWKLFRAA